ncbi:natterin-3-like [Neopsephotus bourkii]|uniref:natterin-3-like n=1 Tax=Neopsephotus bourkii TaxID=309878 RepID=UPI002AA568C0|nr:natterin-3-like [Neopsephotus bourkii]
MAPMGAMGIRQRRATPWLPDAPVSPLQWVPFQGHLPMDTVSNWNPHSQRLEFICSVPGCHSGAYVPSRGPFCFYPFGDRELRSPSFNLLVNIGDLEPLQWANASFGAVPDGAVETCPHDDVFVARTSYGLGKVVKEQRAAFVVVDGEELWFKWYQVLVAKRGPSNVTITHVVYDTSRAVMGVQDVTLATTTVQNRGCTPRSGPIPMETASEVEHDWVLTPNFFTDTPGVLEAAPLLFNGSGWDVGAVGAVPWVGGGSTVEYVPHREVMEREVAVGSACAVALVGGRVDARVPFTARLTRGYGDGHRHRGAVSGWVRVRRVLGVRGRFGPCWSVEGGDPCRV